MRHKVSKMVMKCLIKNVEGRKLLSGFFLEQVIHFHMHQNYKGLEFCTASQCLPTVQTFPRLTSPEKQ